MQTYRYEIEYYRTGKSHKPFKEWLESLRDRLILLLLGGDKSTQQKDVDLATGYWRDHQERKLQCDT